MLMPISCVECRRRKVKCNKQVPCNQCLVRNRQCSYPEKFRSIRVDQFIVDAPENENADTPGSGLVLPTTGAVKSEPPTIPAKRGAEDGPEIVGDAGNDKDEIIQSLRKDNEALKLKIKELKLKYKRDKLKEYDEDNGAEDCGSPKPAGAMYCGPNSTRFMISRALSNADVGEFDDFINVKRQMKQKRQLPLLYEINPEKAKSMTAKQKMQENISLIRRLVCKFFHLRFHYLNYLEEAPLLAFLDNYRNAKTWKDDDDTLLLIIMVLIVVLRSVPASDTLFQEYNLTYERTRPLLYKQYRNLKCGIQIETTTSLRAYILECEDLYFNNQIERSWSLLFRIVSAAYSLGLHVYDETIADTLKKENSETALDIVKKNQRASLWFVINFVSATLCSVLGRPNPVTFTFQPLLRNYEIRLNYKIGLAELVKKSTNILIDSYKVNINFDTIMEIDEAFVSEALIYEKILADTREVRNLKGRDKSKPSYITLPIIDKKARRKNSFKSLSQLNLNQLLNSCPLDIRFTILRPCTTEPEERFCLLDTDCDTLNDLIMLYGNRAKFHQHFMSSYPKSLESCLDSVLKVLDHARLLVELHNNFFHRPLFHDIYPFFYTFFYQTLVVMYTVMHLGYNKLCAYSDTIGAIRQQLLHLFEIVELNYWRPNVVRIMQYINEMCDNYFKMHADVQKQNPSLNARNSEQKAEMGSQSRASGLYQLAMTPIQEDGLPLSSNSKIQVHNVPEHLSQNPTRMDNVASQNSPERIPFYMCNSGNSLSQISLGNCTLDYYDPKQQLFPLPPQTKSTDCQTSGVDQLDSSITVDPLLGFDLSDPFCIQNPSNFNYSAAIDQDNDSDSDAPLTVRPKNTRFNSNDSNDFTNYLSASHNSRGNTL